MFSVKPLNFSMHAQNDFILSVLVQTLFITIKIVYKLGMNAAFSFVQNWGVAKHKSRNEAVRACLFFFSEIRTQILVAYTVFWKFELRHLSNAVPSIYDNSQIQM